MDGWNRIVSFGGKRAFVQGAFAVSSKDQDIMIHPPELAQFYN